MTYALWQANAVVSQHWFLVSCFLFLVSVSVSWPVWFLGAHPFKLSFEPAHTCCFGHGNKVLLCANILPHVCAPCHCFMPEISVGVWPVFSLLASSWQHFGLPPWWWHKMEQMAYERRKLRQCKQRSNWKTKPVLKTQHLLGPPTRLIIRTDFPPHLWPVICLI